MIEEVPMSDEDPNYIILPPAKATSILNMIKSEKERPVKSEQGEFNTNHKISREGQKVISADEIRREIKDDLDKFSEEINESLKGVGQQFTRPHGAKSSNIEIVFAVVFLVGIICTVLQIRQLFGDGKKPNEEDTLKFTNWDGYVHGSMKWGNIDNFIIPNPFSSITDVQYIVGEFEGQIYNNKPHGIGIFKCDKSNAKVCPFKFAYMCFYSGIPHGGPIFMKMANGRSIVFENFRLGHPNGVSIIYEAKGAFDFLTSKQKKEDVSGIVRDIRENHSIMSKEPTKVIEYEEKTAVIFHGIELKNGFTKQKEGLETDLTDQRLTRPYKMPQSEDK
ncbi:hypothetical protein FGO68_gene1310 [Halteria grandinella]|uniref:Uncharacterized protein n=1 Tax=Halteria grandinella TaxID=5974 RepID=A0A8J8P558_HALGN|nr:hypothetical protein FGO68_gene1310 [Halteria grandinella]